MNQEMEFKVRKSIIRRFWYIFIPAYGFAAVIINAVSKQNFAVEPSDLFMLLGWMAILWIPALFMFTFAYDLGFEHGREKERLRHEKQRHYEILS